VDDQAQPAQARLALDPGDEVLGQLDVLERAAEDELAGMDHEGLVAGDLDLLGEVRRRVAQVDRRDAVVVEDAEGRPEQEVDRRGLHAAGIPRIDRDAALLDEPADRAVGEDGARVHGRGS
jgi:hypothetical protein